MKIGLVLDDSLDGSDGVQQYVLAIGEWFRGRGHEVRYLVSATTRRDVGGIHSLSRNLRVRFNGNRLGMPLPAKRSQIRQLLQREQFDVLHIQMPFSPLLAGRVIKAAPARTVIFGTFHVFPQGWAARVGGKLLAVAVRRSLRRFDEVVAVSDAAQAYARGSFGLHTTVLPNVVVVDRFAKADPMRLPTGGTVVMYLGRLVPRKGCMTLLQAFEKARQSAAGSRSRLVICGKGPLEAQLKAYAASHALAEHVTFAGFIDEADKPGYLAAADIAVFPSTGGESFGIVLAEAMASGRPVVLGAANEGYKTVLQDGPGLLFEPGNVTGLSETLIDFLGDAAKRQAAVAWQRQQVAQYDVAVVGSRLEARFAALLRQKQ